MALKEEVQTTIHMHLDHVIFESDSQVVVQVVHKNYGGNFEFSLIISCIKNILVFHFNFEVKFSKLQVNSVAHMLPKADNSWTKRSVLYLIPPCIECLLINDMI